MPTISAVINTLNEESNIAHCLESLKWCDEIIVVDMYSDDKTAEIALKYTDKIFMHERVIAFDIAREFAVGKASGDWILLIDADELVPFELKEELLQIVNMDSDDVVFIPRKNYIMGEWVKHTGFWPDYQPKFFRNGAVLFSEHVHDFMHLTENARKKYLETTPDKSVEHFAYLNSEHFVSKLNRYTTIEAKHMADQGKRFSLFRMLVAGFRGFQVRFINQKGYKDRHRGFFLSVMMGFYRALVYIKLWEFSRDNIAPGAYYAKRKAEIIEGYPDKIGAQQH
jgi:glycosyltransferase involved in cell wall biosynthesis